MPNLPLQTFRAVEGAHCGFTAAATLASQPFVLYHSVFEATGAGSAITSITWPALEATRFRPWQARDFNTTYPVAIPNAYNRVYIYPAYAASTDDSSANVPNFSPTANYSAPYIFPFGLQPETRGYATFNKLNPKMYRFPDDIIQDSYPGAFTNHFDTRTNGIWGLLPPFNTNATSSNGALTAVTNATFGRASMATSPTTTGVGDCFKLPDDFTISSGGTGAVGPADGLPGNNTMSIFGLGHEYQTMGCQELVVSLGSNPTIAWSAVGTASKKYRAHFFLMGVFLG
jgi:hypothetical protein